MTAWGTYHPNRAHTLLLLSDAARSSYCQAHMFTFVRDRAQCLTGNRRGVDKGHDTNTMHAKPCRATISGGDFTLHTTEQKLNAWFKVMTFCISGASPMLYQRRNQGIARKALGPPTIGISWATPSPRLVSGISNSLFSDHYKENRVVQRHPMP